MILSRGCKQHFGGIWGFFLDIESQKEKNLAVTSHALSHDKIVNIYQ